MPYANLQAESFDRRSRRTLAVLATGLTREAVHALLTALRDADPATGAASGSEDAVGYRLATMPLAAQVTHATAAETMAALAAGSLRLAA